MPYRTPYPSADPPKAVRPWILAGGFGLAAVAGYVNVAMLGVFAVPVSHMTGAVSRLGTDIATGNSHDSVLVLSIVGGFLLGAATSGAIVGGDQLLPGRRYGIALLAEAIALAAATTLLSAGIRAGIPFAALACGIQNGMASSYFGLIIRTTHVTGIVTDLGVLAGQRLRGRRTGLWKPALLIGLLLGFLVGGVSGQLMAQRYGPEALGLAAVVCLAAGIGYYVWRHVAPSGRVDV